MTLVNALSKALEEAGVELYRNTEATSLIVDENGRVCGVKATAADGSEEEFAGRTVLLATGGFHGSVRIDGTGSGDAFIFGHLAGEKIAEAVLG